MSLRRNVIASYVGQGWAALMGIVFVPAYISYLGIESYGLIGAFSIVMTCCTLLDAGMAPTLNREMARFSAGAHSPASIVELMRSVEVLGVILIALIALSGFLLSGFLARHWLSNTSLPQSTVSEALSLMTAVAALRVMEGVYRSALIGLQHYIRANIASATLATLRYGGVVLALTYWPPTIKTFFVWQIVASLLGLTAFCLATWHALPRSSRRPRPRLGALFPMWSFARGMILISILSLLLSQTDKIILSSLVSLQTFAQYALAALLANGLAAITMPLAMVYYPRLTQLVVAGDYERLCQTYHQGAELVSIIVGTVAIILIVFSRELLSLWTGNASLADSTSQLLSLLATGTLLNMLMWMPYYAQLAHGWTTLTLRLNLISVLALVPALFVAVPMFGALGAAWVWLILNALSILVGIYLMHKRILLNERTRWYRHDIGLPILGAFTVASVCRWLLPASADTAVVAAELILSTILTLIAATLAAPSARNTIFSRSRPAI